MCVPKDPWGIARSVSAVNGHKKGARRPRRSVVSQRLEHLVGCVLQPGVGGSQIVDLVECVLGGGGVASLHLCEA